MRPLTPVQSTPVPVNVPSSPPIPIIGGRQKTYNQKVAAGIGLLSLGLLLAAISTAAAWWGMWGSTIYNSRSYDTTYEWFTNKLCVTVVGGPTGAGSACLPYTPGMESVRSLFATTLSLAIVALILAATTVALVVICIFRPRSRHMMFVVGLLASLVMIVAVLYIFVALPGIMNGSSGGIGPAEQITGFFGRSSFTQGPMRLDLSYGGGIGWVLGIMASVLFLVGTISADVGFRPLPEWEVVTYTPTPPTRVLVYPPMEKVGQSSQASLSPPASACQKIEPPPEKPLQ